MSYEFIHPQSAKARSILRRAGLLALLDKTQGRADFRIALIDGPVSKDHSSLVGASISQPVLDVESDPTSAVARHATFTASMLVGRGANVVGLCPACALISIPVVSEAMISGQLPARAVAECLAEAVRRAVVAGTRVIQLSLEFPSTNIGSFKALADAFAAAARAGVRTVMPAGNRPIPNAGPLLESLGVVPVAMMDWNDLPHSQSALGVTVTQRGLLAPGTDIPGALSPQGFTVRSGSSFAASLVTGAFALLSAVATRKSSEEIWHALLAYRRGLQSLFVPRRLDVEASFARLHTP